MKGLYFLAVTGTLVTAAPMPTGMVKLIRSSQEDKLAPRQFVTGETDWPVPFPIPTEAPEPGAALAVRAHERTRHNKGTTWLGGEMYCIGGPCDQKRTAMPEHTQAPGKHNMGTTWLGGEMYCIGGPCDQKRTAILEYTQLPTKRSEGCSRSGMQDCTNARGFEKRAVETETPASRPNLVDLFGHEVKRSLNFIEFMDSMSPEERRKLRVKANALHGEAPERSPASFKERNPLADALPQHLEVKPSAHEISTRMPIQAEATATKESDETPASENAFAYPGSGVFDRRGNPSGEFMVINCHPQSIDEGNGVFRQVDRCWVRGMDWKWWTLDIRHLSTIDDKTSLVAAKNINALNRHVFYSRFICQDAIIEEWHGTLKTKRCVEYKGVEPGQVAPEWDVEA